MAIRSAVRSYAIRALEAATAVTLIVVMPLRLLMRQFDAGQVSYWTGTPIITLALKARAERMLGVRARSLVTNEFYVTSDFDVNLSRWRSLPVVGLLVPFAAFVWVCVSAKRVHAYHDRGVLPPRSEYEFNPFEITVYRLLHIELLLWTYGADVRTRAATATLGEPNCCTECVKPGVACVCDAERHARNVARLRRHARATFAMGDMIEYTPGSRNDLFFWPVDLDAGGGERYRPSPPVTDAGRPLRVVHAPNHRVFKGTRHLERAIDLLRANGQPIELRVVQGISNSEALDVYRSADIVFDQCLIGFHGYFALEAMALAKPVMCFVRDPDRYLLAPEECPIINTHVATLVDDLRSLIMRRHELPEIGARGRRYIERHYTPAAFAARLRRAYDDLGMAV